MPDVMSPSQRARTILATSSSAHVTGVELDEPLAQPADRLVLCADPVAPGERVRSVEVEVADAAPLTTRERIRGRVRISGCAVTSSGCDALHVHPREVVLLADGEEVDIDVEDLLAAEPDPLHEIEASTLAHLEARHGDVVVTLTRLVDARLRQGVVRVWPYRLDQHGLVLRLEYATGHADHRLAFREPLTSTEQLPAEMTALIGRAVEHALPCARRATAGPLGPILRSAAAVRRVCGSEHDDTSG
jgi:hypothetical protein